MRSADLRQHTDTRERILDAAEALFVEHGFEATTMRMITGRAGVNLASINYHFGSKEALIQDVFRRRLTWLNEERLNALDRFEKEAKGAPLKPHQIVEAFFGVSLRMAADTEHGGHTFMRLLGGECIDDALEDQRHADVRQLGGDQAGQREQHAAPIGPNVGNQAADGLPVAALADVRGGQGAGGIGAAHRSILNYLRPRTAFLRRLHLNPRLTSLESDV